MSIYLYFCYSLLDFLHWCQILCEKICFVDYIESGSINNIIIFKWSMCVLVAQSCLTLCNPLNYSPPGSSVHGDSLNNNTGMGCHALLQGIFPTQGSNPHLLCLLHGRQILYLSSHQRSPKWSIDIWNV